MLRRLFSRLLGADLEPIIAWGEAESAEAMARIAVDVPRFWGGTELEEQVLCKAGEEYVLWRRWSRSRHQVRVTFRAPLNGREMRLTEWVPGARPIYRLMLWPVDFTAVSFASATGTWFGLWRNEEYTNQGASLCYLNSPDRELLKDLRFKLLEGNVPQSLQNEEEMWQQINGMSETERRAAMAALTMQSLGAMERNFQENYPDAGPIPEDLQPAFDVMQQRVREIERTAETHPVDPALAKLIQRFVLDATHRTAQGPHAPPSADKPDA